MIHLSYHITSLGAMSVNIFVLIWILSSSLLVKSEPIVDWSFLNAESQYNEQEIARAVIAERMYQQINTVAQFIDEYKTNEMQKALADSTVRHLQSLREDFEVFEIPESNEMRDEAIFGLKGILLKFGMVLNDFIEKFYSLRNRFLVCRAGELYELLETYGPDRARPIIRERVEQEAQFLDSLLSELGINQDQMTLGLQAKDTLETIESLLQDVEFTGSEEAEETALLKSLIHDFSTITEEFNIEFGVFRTQFIDMPKMQFIPDSQPLYGEMKKRGSEYGKLAIKELLEGQTRRLRDLMSEPGSSSKQEGLVLSAISALEALQNQLQAMMFHKSDEMEEIYILALEGLLFDSEMIVGDLFQNFMLLQL